MMYPKLGFNTYQMPPPSAKIGSPTSPSTAYNPTLMAPSLPPMIRPASMVNRNCSVNGTTVTGSGWKLELKPGYRLAAGTRVGDQIVTKE